ncbi:MAG: non-canonical purine NTP pyrophosphatase [Rubrivivax sp. SCN 71-131]|jgi:XTP/dITP diphosphohydrolase|nr:MAG: non-canonical purine NTP pyrophosphatase [Rubrivivax sp. SCN 71-131]
MRVVLASNNAKKLAELQALFAGLPLQLVTQDSLGIPEAEEPFATFFENGLAKARHAARLSGLPALADDSGLCVDALGGRPGVASAHFAPAVDGDDDREARRRAQDGANNALLLQRLSGQPDRRAAFVCTLVALRHADDPEPLLACGRWVGQILTAPRGAGGFGYDPLVFIPSLARTVAELDAATKNRLSHRALAATRLRERLREDWRIG